MDNFGLDILVIEDDFDTGASVRDLLELRGHRVRLVADTGSACSEVGTRAPDVVLSDFHLGTDTSESALRRLASSRPSVRRVLMSSAEEIEWKSLLDDGVIERALPKPFEFCALLEAIDAIAPPKRATSA
jgi:DNA-binding response OmpR family regulator